jgi:hypothetical protein
MISVRHLHLKGIVKEELIEESPPKSPEKPSGIDAFPSLDEPAPTSEVRVTGFGGLEGDEDREKFESAFPDLSGEVPNEQVSLSGPKDRTRARSSERSE